MQQAPKPKVRRVRRTRYNFGVPVASVWLCIWIIISIILMDIALAQFSGDRNYLTLLTWGTGIAVGYFFSILILVLARRKRDS